LPACCRKLATTGNITADELEGLKGSLDMALDLKELQQVLSPFARAHVHKIVGQQEGGGVSLNRTALKNAIGSIGVGELEVGPEGDSHSLAGDDGHSHADDDDDDGYHQHQEADAAGGGSRVAGAGAAGGTLASEEAPGAAAEHRGSNEGAGRRLMQQQ
jgi:hypothetical protein